MEFDKSIICDIGTYMTKVGLNDQEKPEEPKLKFETVIDDRFPLKRGKTPNMKDYEVLFDRIFKELGVDADDYALVYAEPVHFPPAIKENLCKLLFEKYSVQAINFTQQCVLNLFSIAEDTGISVEFGEGLTQVSPVYKGYGISHAMGKMNVGGFDVNKELLLALKERDIELKTFKEREIVREWKHDFCYVASDFQAEVAKWKEKQHCNQKVTLPDGKEFTLGVELFRGPEIYFSTSHLDIPNVVDTIEKSIKNSYMDVRKDLWKKVYISGGSSEMDGLRIRLWDELKKRAPQQDLVRVREHPSEYSVFQGGTVLAQLSDFDDEYFAKEDYEEDGVKGIHKKKRVKDSIDGSDSESDSGDDDSD